MIAGIKTAAEAKADALVWQQIFAAPNSIGTKIIAEMQRIMEFQKQNPTALETNVTGDVRIPTAAVTQIQTTWGYVLTVVNGVGKPAGYNGAITNWSRITKVSWNI